MFTLPKLAEFALLIFTLFVYTVWRSSHLLWWERFLSGGINAALAVIFAPYVGPYVLGGELIAGVIIMLSGQFILSLLFMVSEPSDKKFVKGLMRAWAAKQLGVKVESENDTNNE